MLTRDQMIFVLGCWCGIGMTALFVTCWFRGIWERLQ
jgi:hypothetical protein